VRFISQLHINYSTFFHFLLVFDWLGRYIIDQSSGVAAARRLLASKQHYKAPVAAAAAFRAAFLAHRPTPRWRPLPRPHELIVLVTDIAQEIKPTKAPPSLPGFGLRATVPITSPLVITAMASLAYVASVQFQFQFYIYIFLRARVWVFTVAILP
jgi:hypothetical protein